MAQHAGAHGAVLQRRGVFIKRDQRGKFLRDMGQEFADEDCGFAVDVAGNAAGHDTVHHQPMPENDVRHSQHALAQDRAMREHQAERCVVAHGADVADMVGDTFQLEHDGAQI